MCLLRSTKWVFVPQKTGFFIRLVSFKKNKYSLKPHYKNSIRIDTYIDTFIFITMILLYTLNVNNITKRLKGKKPFELVIR
jgi:hypothetical protein